MRKNFFQSMKEIFRDWDLKVMSYVMLVVTATCVITATVAWFTFSVSASVQNMEIKTGDAEVIRVAVEAGGEDVDAIRANGKTPEFTIDMPVFTNVTQSGESTNVLAPGTYGSVTIYVTPLTKDVTKCKILPSFSCSKDAEDTDDSEDDEDSEESSQWLTYMAGVSEEDQAVIESLVKGHILFFSAYDKTNGYSGLLTEGGDPLECDLTWGEETPITIYWYWPYEYEDIPDEVEEALSDEEDYKLFDSGDGYASSDSQSTDIKSKRYDYADTKIGTNVKSVKFHVEVSAVYGSN